MNSCPSQSEIRGNTIVKDQKVCENIVKKIKVQNMQETP